MKAEASPPSHGVTRLNLCHHLVSLDVIIYGVRNHRIRVCDGQLSRTDVAEVAVVPRTLRLLSPEPCRESIGFGTWKKKHDEKGARLFFRIP